MFIVKEMKEENKGKEAECEKCVERKGKWREGFLERRGRETEE